NMIVIRPADANEVTEAWRVVMEQKQHPVALCLTRQNLPTLDRTKFAPATGLRQGGYILSDCAGTPDIILIGTGSELQLVIEAGAKLTAEGVKVRVISLPSWELFEQQPAEYRAKVLPASVRKRVAVEAGSSQGWHRYIGLDGALVTRDAFGASAPFKDLFKQFGFTTENVYQTAKSLLASKAK
ncbi:MAG: transketolase C-terminal domain-containing protein, partial [Verrucomicrobiota bacterium]